MSSAGFWAGGGPVDDAAFYSYAYPSPEGFAEASVKPETAYWDTSFGDFILPYEAVRTSANPKRTLMAFLESTYEAAASLGDWDRSTACARDQQSKPLPID